MRAFLLVMHADGHFRTSLALEMSDNNISLIDHKKIRGIGKRIVIALSVHGGLHGPFHTFRIVSKLAENKMT